MLKTYREDFSIESRALNPKSIDLGELMARRHADCMKTVKYWEALKEYEAVAAEIEAVADRELALRLESAVNALEIQAFNGGYRNGIVDLMTAITFNRAGVIGVDYIDFSAFAEAESAPTGK